MVSETRRYRHDRKWCEERSIVVCNLLKGIRRRTVNKLLPFCLSAFSSHSKIMKMFFFPISYNYWYMTNGKGGLEKRESVISDFLALGNTRSTRDGQ